MNVIKSGVIVSVLVGLIFSISAFAAPFAKPEIGVMILPATKNLTIKPTLGIGFENFDFDIAFNENQLSFLPCIHAGHFFATVVGTMDLPLEWSKVPTFSFPIGYYVMTPSGSLKIGYSYPLFKGINGGFFIQFNITTNILDTVSVSNNT